MAFRLRESRTCRCAACGMDGDGHGVGPQNFGWLVEPAGELYPFSLLLCLWRLGIRCCRWCGCGIGRGRPRLERRSSRRGRLHLHVASHHHRDLERRCRAKPKESFRPDVDFLPACNRVSTGPEASAQRARRCPLLCRLQQGHR